jgi:hypothetical protein
MDLIKINTPEGKQISNLLMKKEAIHGSVVSLSR